MLALAKHNLFIEPTHTRVGFYALPLIVWIPLSMLYVPRTAIDYLITVLITLSITVLLPSLLARKPQGDIYFCTLMNALFKKLPQNSTAVYESTLLNGKMSCAGIWLYGFVAAADFSAIVFFYINKHPSFLTTILIAFLLDLLMTIVLRRTDIATLLHAAQATPHGICLYRLNKKSLDAEWRDLGFEFYYIGFGMTKLVIKHNGDEHCCVLDIDLLRFVRYHIDVAMHPKNC